MDRQARLTRVDESPQDSQRDLRINKLERQAGFVEEMLRNGCIVFEKPIDEMTRRQRFVWWQFRILAPRLDECVFDNSLFRRFSVATIQDYFGSQLAVELENPK